MKHAREDYNRRIIDVDGTIPENEPVFLFRGQDKLAPQVLDFYADLLAEEKRKAESEIPYLISEYGEDDEGIAALRSQRANLEAMEFATRRHASEMRMWNTQKTPDMQLPLPFTDTSEKVRQILTED